MPDRDIFTALSPTLRPGARSILGTACGKDLEFLPVAEALNDLFNGGVAALGRTLKCFASLSGDERQACFDGFAYIHRAALNEVYEHYGKTWRDDLLCQEAIRAYGLGIRDEQLLLRRFAMSAIKSQIIEARGGVAEQLTKRGLKLNVQELEQQMSPLLDTTAAMMLRNPSFKRLGLASRFRREVDLYGENLL